ncbi:MAG TPA: ABC transporter substrate-binding protein [Candidatus Sulfotelmatobacter sp.]|nr:ABC transporter substrate-binding protein [Candidatus Sulfotelmatobacter sp.]
MKGAKQLTRWTTAAAAALAVAGGVGLSVAPARAETVIKAVMATPARILDPIFTTAYAARDHGYMVFDTLFALDANFKVQPQMLKDWTISDDKLTYTFTLRDGLKFHDGAPVTSDDCIASIKRWGAVDGMGQKLMDFTKEMVAVNDKTFKLVLKEPYGLVLQSLAKPSSNVPFMMPKRLADTDPHQQIKEQIGSGPFKFVQAEFNPDVKIVYEKNTDYVPRSEPPSWGAGGKVVKVDRVEHINMTDSQTIANALIAGEIDWVEFPAYDLIPMLKNDPKIKIENLNPLGSTNMVRMNQLWPPFDNPKIRQAVLHAINQEDYLEAQVGNPEYYKKCFAMFVCGTPLATDVGASQKPDLELAKKLLKEGGYDGTPVVVMQPTDIAILAPLAPVTVQAMRAIGMKVDMQSMDWQTLVARRAKQDAPDKGGWNMFHTTWVNADMLTPVQNLGVNGRGKVGGWFGWPKDDEVEKLRDQFARETDPEKQKQIAADIQKRAYDDVMWIPTGIYYQPTAWRTTLTGVLQAPVPFFWNIEKH